jgi:hypothetical protein
MTDFEKWLQTTPEYKILVFQHGERLLIQRDGEYVILPVRLAHRSYVLNKTNIEEDYAMSSSDYKWHKANHYLQVVVIICLYSYAILLFFNLV